MARPEPDVQAGRPRLIVVALSEAFADVWTHLAAELQLVLTVMPEEDPFPAGGDVAAVILAAGGAEHEALDWLERQEWPRDVPFLVVGADPGRRMAVQLMRRGASDYLALPEDIELLNNAVAAALRRFEARRRAADAAGTASNYAFEAIVGESPALRTVLHRASRILPRGDSTILIVGETGTGKELLAHALHEGGPRRGAPFVPVNCAALPASLIESELFGHERGAFTDAHTAKPGLFEVADGGTLFLDEIGTLPLALQARLLRVLDDRHVRRVGGTRSRRVDVRLIAATNEDLERAVAERRFREDLYYRLNVMTLRLPPLRERGRDAVLIAERLLRREAQRHGLPVPTLGPEACQRLLAYHWPGNVRELKNAVERALWLSPPGELRLEELSPPASPQPPSGSLPFPAPLRAIEAAAARATLEACGGNRSETARRLAISRHRLARLLADRRPHTPRTRRQEDKHA